MRLKLEIARKLKGLKQKDIAKKLGISSSYYEDIENGSKNPSINLAFNIAFLLEHENEFKDLFKNLNTDDT